jgi:hypothetical protein
MVEKASKTDSRDARMTVLYTYLARYSALVFHHKRLHRVYIEVDIVFKLVQIVRHVHVLVRQTGNHSSIVVIIVIIAIDVGVGVGDTVTTVRDARRVDINTGGVIVATVFCKDRRVVGGAGDTPVL